MKIWVELGITVVGTFVLRFAGRWGMAVVAGVAAGGCLLMAGSLRATALLFGRAADSRGLGEDREPTAASSGVSRRRSPLERAPQRTGLLIDFALYFAGVAAALFAFPAHAGAAGWAASSVGILASSWVGDRFRLRVALFAPAAMAAAALALVWVPPGSELQIVRTGSAALVMSAGSCALGTSILAMRWKLSPRLSLPPAMALAVWSLTWFFARGEEFGHEPFIVARGVGVGVVVAALGYVLRAVDGPAAGVALFVVSRVYGFLDWPASIPLLAATVLGWRPFLRRGTPSEAAGAATRRHGAAYELAVGILPLALAGSYFTWKNPVFLSAYLAACSGMSATIGSQWFKASSRARAGVAMGMVLALCLVPVMFGEYPKYGAREFGTALAGGLLGWLAGEVLRATAPGWKELPSPLRRATLGGVSAILSFCAAAAVLARKTYPC